MPFRVIFEESLEFKSFPDSYASLRDSSTTVSTCVVIEN